MRASSLIALAFALTAQAGAVIELKISGAGSFSGVRNAIVKATLTNTGDEIARILNEPNTVLSKMETHTFAIFNTEGVAPQFTGKLGKFHVSSCKFVA